MRQTHSVTALLAALVAVGLVAVRGDAPAAAAGHQTYFVDQKAGDDANPGTEDRPWASLRRAMQSDVVAGDTVYVKSGIYHNERAPYTFSPANSGTPEAPIAFRAWTPPDGPRHHPVLSRTLTAERGVADINPVVGVQGGPAGKAWIVWDGFTLVKGTNVVVGRCTGCVIENMDIAPGPKECESGNWVGIFVSTSTKTEIRNNRIHDIRYTGGGRGCNADNAAGIVLYDTRQTWIHHNEFFDAATGINDKENGVANVHERNYFHDLAGPAVAFSAFAPSRCGACPVEDTVVRHNVVYRAGTGVFMALARGMNARNIAVYGNTMVAVGRGVRGGSIPGIQTYNNVIDVDGGSQRGGAYVYYDGPPADLRSDFSNFSGAARFYPEEFKGGESLSGWRGRGLDKNSTSVEPHFVGPLDKQPPAGAFRLRPDSPLRRAGREGGVATGAPVDMGAYVSDGDVVGPVGTSGGRATAPAAGGRSGS